MKKLIICLFVAGCFHLVNAQVVRDETTAMHRFMQANADSTIVVQYTGGWIDPPMFYLLSKKEDTVTCYLYKDDRKYTSINAVPRKIGVAMSSRTWYDIYKTPVDINRFFNVYEIQPDSLIAFWNKVSALKPWEIKDDSIEGKGCPIAKNRSITIDDGAGICVHLITRDNIKTLTFYEPDSFERYCPGRK